MVDHTFWFCTESELLAWCREDPYLVEHPALLSKLRRTALVLLDSSE